MEIEETEICEECKKAVKSKGQQKFKEDMGDAGYEVEFYCGRFYYHGYAVSCNREEAQDIIRATNIILRSDSMGLGVILYPQ